MKPFEWSPDKNLSLMNLRGLGFNDAVGAILAGKLLDRIKHPNQQKYPGQQIFIVEINGYCYNVPFVESADVIFLKTIYRSRKSAKKYLRERK